MTHCNTVVFDAMLAIGEHVASPARGDIIWRASICPFFGAGVRHSHTFSQKYEIASIHPCMQRQRFRKCVDEECIFAPDPPCGLEGAFCTPLTYIPAPAKAMCKQETYAKILRVCTYSSVISDVLEKNNS